MMSNTMSRATRKVMTNEARMVVVNGRGKQTGVVAGSPPGVSGGDGMVSTVVNAPAEDCTSGKLHLKGSSGAHSASTSSAALAGPEGGLPQSRSVSWVNLRFNR